MILSLYKKKQIISQLHEVIKTGVLSAVVASLEKITANAVNVLRKEARDVGVCMYVVRNTLMRRVIIKTPFECLIPVFTGQSIIAFSTRKPSDAARVFIEFTKVHESFKIKGAAFEGKFIGADQIDLLSNLPDYKEVILQLIVLMKISSVGNFIHMLRVLSVRNDCGIKH